MQNSKILEPQASVVLATQLICVLSFSSVLSETRCHGAGPEWLSSYWSHSSLPNAAATGKHLLLIRRYKNTISTFQSTSGSRTRCHLPERPTLCGTIALTFSSRLWRQRLYCAPAVSHFARLPTSVTNCMHHVVVVRVHRLFHLQIIQLKQIFLTFIESICALSVPTSALREV